MTAIFSSLVKRSGIYLVIFDPRTRLVFFPKSHEFTLVETKPVFDSMVLTLILTWGK